MNEATLLVVYFCASQNVQTIPDTHVETGDLQLGRVHKCLFVNGRPSLLAGFFPQPLHSGADPDNDFASRGCGAPPRSKGKKDGKDIPRH